MKNRERLTERKKGKEIGYVFAPSGKAQELRKTHDGSQGQQSG